MMAMQELVVPKSMPRMCAIGLRVCRMWTGGDVNLLFVYNKWLMWSIRLKIFRREASS
jgi:dolichyl-phosphate-mannose--protein O-mannosyl transferase